MTTAYKHRPLSSILAPATDPRPEGSNAEQPRDEQGRFASPEQELASLPDKYQGKTAQELAEMHMNAEKELGRMRNEVGTYRGLVNDLTQLQRKPVESKTVEQEPLDVSGDKLLIDPVGTIDAVVSRRLNEAKPDEAPAPTADELVASAESTALLNDYPNLDQIVGDPKFQEFVSRTASRQNDFMTAAKGEGVEAPRAARRLLEDYQDFGGNTSAVSSEPEPQPAPAEAQNPELAAARAVSNEGAGPAGAISSKPLIHETDVLKLIATDPERYRSPSYQTELLAAMREGRYVKQ